MNTGNEKSNNTHAKQEKCVWTGRPLVAKYTTAELKWPHDKTHEYF